MELLSIDLYNPYVLIGLFIGIVVFIYFTTKQPQFNPVQPPKKLIKDMTRQQLSKYSHKSKQATLLALKGVIYDVSSSQSYKTGGSYASFTGHDASISLAKMSHDQDLLDKYGKVTLNEDQQKVLDDWVIYFGNKYHIVGKIIQ